jgi:heterodisulfide reductase subunit C
MRKKISVKELHDEIIQRVEEISGQNLMNCYQCGKCSAGCPVVEAMDILPNQIIRLVQLGLVQEALDSKTIWLCASCITCTSRCPKGVDVARVMEALRAIILRRQGDKVSPSELPSEILKEVPQQGLVSFMRKLCS